MNPTPHGPVTLQAGVFDTLFPFHVAFDRAGLITRTGPSLSRLAERIRPGARLADVLEARRPDTLPDHANFSAMARRVVILREPLRDILLRGQLVPLGDDIAFLCSPWLTDADAIQRFGLSLHDFALHDPTADLVQLVQVQRLATADLQRLAARLTETRDHLRSQEAEARKLALIVARTGNAVVITDREGRVEWANEGFRALTGYGLGEARGRRPGDFLQGPKTDLACVERMHAHLARAEGFQEEVLNYRKDGRPYWVSLDVQPIRDESGNLVNFMAIQADITRRKELEFSLRESEQRFALALNATGEGVWDWDLRSDTVRHNQRWLDLLGVGPEFLVHDLARFTERIHPADRPGVLARVRDCLAGKGAYSSRHRMVRGDGKIIWVEDRGDVAQYDSAGNPLRMVGSIADVSERHVADESLRVQFGLARALSAATSLTEAAASSLRVICAEMHWSHGAFWAPSSEGPHLVRDTIHPPGAPAGAATLAATLAPGEGLVGRVWQSREADWAPGTGTETSGLIFATPIHAGERTLGVLEFHGSDAGPPAPGRVRTLAALGAQLGQFFERMRAEERLRRRGEELLVANTELARASRLKDAFLASMSHELRTPLNSILGLAETLAEGVHGPLNDHQTRYLGMVLSSGRHLLELINDILDLAKLEAGHHDLALQPCDLREICVASLQIIQPAARQRRQALAAEPPPPGIIVRADARRLQQVFINLLGNAVKFTPEGGRLGLRVTRSEHEVSIAVWDEGIGIPDEHLPRLFQPFVQLDSRLARGHGGTGLGLSLVKQFVTLHGGRVDLETAPGRGSTFTVVLPLPGPADPGNPPLPSPASSPAAPEPAAPEPLRAPPGPGPFVLIADDIGANTVAVADLLLAHGFQVATAEDGNDALRQIRERRPALVLMDIQMPVLDGLEAIRLLRQEPDPALARTPVIALTGLAMSGDRERCLRAGADDYLAKPASPREILARLRSTLAARA